MAYSPAPLALDRSKPGPWNAEGAFVAPEYQDLWRGLIRAVPLWEGSGYRPFDVARRQSLVTQNTPAWQLSPFGLSHRTLENNIHRTELGVLEVASGMSVVIPAYMESAIGSLRLFSMLFSGGDDVRLFRSSSGGNINLSMDDGSFTNISTSLTNGQWYVFVFTHDGSTVRLYVDGALIGSSNETFNYASANKTAYIADQATAGGQEWAGGWAGCLVWDRGLTASEVVQVSSDPFGLIRPNWDYLTTAFSSTSLFATGDGTIVDVVNENDAASPLSPSVDDDPSSPDDNDWVNNGVGV